MVTKTPWTTAPTPIVLWKGYNMAYSGQIPCDRVLYFFEQNRTAITVNSEALFGHMLHKFLNPEICHRCITRQYMWFQQNGVTVKWVYDRSREVVSKESDIQQRRCCLAATLFWSYTTCDLFLWGCYFKSKIDIAESNTLVGLKGAIINEKCMYYTEYHVEESNNELCAEGRVVLKKRIRIFNKYCSTNDYFL